MNDDPAHILVIPAWPEVTVTDTHHGQALEIPPNLWRAIDIWYCIRSEEVSRKVGAIIQQRLDSLRVSR